MNAVVHENSLLAYHEGLRDGVFSKRQQAILDFLDKSPSNLRFTDREIMLGMGFVDPNAVRPRITELVKAGVLVELEEGVSDPITGKTVRRVAIKADPRGPQRLFKFA